MFVYHVNTEIGYTLHEAPAVRSASIGFQERGGGIRRDLTGKHANVSER